MKKIVNLLCSLLCLSATAQPKLADNFKVGTFLELYNGDSIKVYFNCVGVIKDKKCAGYYRVGKIDSTWPNVGGNFTDYYISGKRFFEGTMKDNNLSGSGTYYYENGKIKEEGEYDNNVRTGVWTFYYSNGKIQKIYDYFEGEPVVVEAYDRKGKAVVQNKNGFLKTRFTNYHLCSPFETAGSVKNGKKDGKWSFSNIGAFPISYEIYDEGTYIKSISNGKDYQDIPRIGLTETYATEILNLYENFMGCPGNSIITIRYDDSIGSYLPQIQQRLSKYDLPVRDQWLLVSLEVNKNDNVETINVASSVNDEKLENYIYHILRDMKNWRTAIINSKKTNSYIFFSVVANENELIIPADYFRRNSGSG